jgi:hypothetical protein
MTMTERRTGGERRHRSLGAYCSQQLRRKSGRRSSDHFYPIIDFYPRRTLAAALAIMVLCCCDAFITIELLARGAVEANPAMALLMQAGMGWFGAIKLSLTATGVVVLVACSAKRLFRRISGELLLHALLACYVLLIAYEAWLGFELSSGFTY